MHPSLVIARRIVKQLLHDHRSLALALVVPSALLTLFKLILENEVDGRPIGNFDRLAPPLIATFVFLFVFILSTVSFLRERTEGTFERLLTTPVRHRDIIIGYMLGFLGLAVVQSAINVTFLVWVLDAGSNGPLVLVFLIQFMLAICAVNLGVMLSTFARTELQAVQFVPLVIVPQVFLAGTIFPIDVLPTYLRELSWLLPLRYGIEATRDVMISGNGIGHFPLLRDLLVIAGFGSAFIAGASLAIKRL